MSATPPTTTQPGFPAAAAGPDHAWCALVTADGAVEEVSGRAAARSLRGAPDIVAYARALIASDRSTAEFWWRAAAGWWHVWIELVDGLSPSTAMASSDKTSVGAAAAQVWFVQTDPPKRLTTRELDVLTLIAGGLSNTEIATQLFTSPKTISTHVEHVLKKLGTVTRAGAAAVAIEQGLVRLPIPGGASGLQSLTIGVLDQARRASAVPAPAPAGGKLLRRKRPFLLGSAFPLNGPAQADGLEMRNGSALAIAEINSRGGVAQRPIEQVVVDADIFSQEGVERAFEQLAAADVDAITGGYVFAEEAARDAASVYGAPYLHATTSERQIELIRAAPDLYGRIFHVCPSERHYGSGFIRFLDTLVGSGRWHPTSRRLLFIECAVPSGQMANTATVDSAERSGWLIDHVEVVPAIGADWGQVVGAIHRRDPAAIMITQFLPGELADFQRAFVSDPTESLIYAVYTPSIPQFLDQAGPSAEGLIWSTVTGTYGDQIGTAFAQRYRDAYGHPPGRSHAGIAYDEVHLIAQAWATAGNPRNFAAVAAQLRRVAYRGVNGTYVFDHAGQCGLAYPDVTPDPSLGQAHLVLQIQGGRHRTLAPAPYSASQFIRPPWLRCAS